MIWPPFSPYGDAASQDAEQRLITAAQKGDHAAFSKLRALYDLPLTRFVTRRAGLDSADDIVQETWLAAWQGIKKWNGRARFKAWLFAIAENKCIDQHRANARQLRLRNFDDLHGYPPDRIDDYDAVDLRQAVQSVVVNLPSNQREVIELYYYHELTLLEIAELLKRNLNTVKYQFYRAHALVAEGLSPLQPSPVRPSESRGREKS